MGLGGILSKAAGIPGVGTAMNVVGSNPMTQGILGKFLGGNQMSTAGGPATSGGVLGPGQGTGGTTPFNVEDFISNNPAYKFIQEEGLRGLQRTAAAKGEFGSGNLMRDLTSFSSGLASQSYNTEVDRIMKMAGVGAGSPGAAGQVYAGTAAEGQDDYSQGVLGLGNIFSLFQ